MRGPNHQRPARQRVPEAQTAPSAAPRVQCANCQSDPPRREHSRAAPPQHPQNTPPDPPSLAIPGARPRLKTALLDGPVAAEQTYYRRAYRADLHGRRSPRIRSGSRPERRFQRGPKYLRLRHSVSKSSGPGATWQSAAHASAACAVPFWYACGVPDQVQRESSQRATTPVCPEYDICPGFN